MKFLESLKEGFAGEAWLEHVLAREVTNGMWFLASAFLLASLLKFIVPRLIKNPVLWRQELEVRLAWGIALIAAGTALRAGWIWAILITSSWPDARVAREIEDLSWLSYLAIGLGIWGAVCTVKAITEAANARHSNTYLWLYWGFVVATTVTIPVIVSFL